MKKMVILFFGLVSLAAGAFSADQGLYTGVNPQPITGTVMVGKLRIKFADALVEKKEGYIFLLFDAFPYHKDLLETQSGPSLEKVVKALVRADVLDKYPKATKVKADIVEYSERDDYGAPRWDKVHVIGRFVVGIRHGKTTVKKVAGESIVQ